MDRDVILSRLAEGFCFVRFKKVSTAEDREMVCTRNANLIPKGELPSSTLEDFGFGNIAVWEKNNGWRSFYPDSVEEFQAGV